MTPARYRRLRSILDRRQPDLTVLVEGLSKPHNVAAVMRTCDAVGVHEIHAPSASESFKPSRASAAGIGRYVGVRTHPDLATAAGVLHDGGFQILAAHLTPSAVDYRDVDYTRPTALLLGTELDGVSPEAIALADGAVAIPMAGAVESLNVSVAAAVILYEAQRQRAARGCTIAAVSTRTPASVCSSSGAIGGWPKCTGAAASPTRVWVRRGRSSQGEAGRARSSASCLTSRHHLSNCRSRLRARGALYLDDATGTLRKNRASPGSPFALPRKGCHVSFRLFPFHQPFQPQASVPLDGVSPNTAGSSRHLFQSADRRESHADTDGRIQHDAGPYHTEPRGCFEPRKIAQMRVGGLFDHGIVLPTVEPIDSMPTPDEQADQSSDYSDSPYSLCFGEGSA